MKKPVTILYGLQIILLYTSSYWQSCHKQFINKAVAEFHRLERRNVDI